MQFSFFKKHKLKEGRKKKNIIASDIFYFIFYFAFLLKKNKAKVEQKS
jgi:hypothetical protein